MCFIYYYFNLNQTFSESMRAYGLRFSTQKKKKKTAVSCIKKKTHSRGEKKGLIFIKKKKTTLH